MCCDVFVFTCILNPLVVYCLLNLCLATRVRSFQAANPSSFSLFFLVVLTLRCVTSGRTEPRKLLLQRHSIHSSSTLVRSNEGVFVIKWSICFRAAWRNESLWPIKPFDSSRFVCSSVSTNFPCCMLDTIEINCLLIMYWRIREYLVIKVFFYSYRKFYTFFKLAFTGILLYIR